MTTSRTKKLSFSKRFMVLVLVVLMVFFGMFVWWREATSAVNVENQTSVSFEVIPGSSVKQIAADLTDQDLIRSPIAFFLLVKVRGLEKSLQAGDFRLNQSMDSYQIADQLTLGMRDIWITALEGWRSEEIAHQLAKDLDIPESEFLAVANEGFMFPDTYRVPEDATAAAIADIFISNFNSKITADMRSQIDKSGLTLKQIITLASLVEREGINKTDRPIIAGILLNRLQADWSLQVDATLQYVLGYQPQEKSWWKQNLTEADKEIDSLYNTYKYPGLPPAPIANPGLDSINAVIYPAQTSYWYYLHDDSGQVHYAQTLEQHNQNIQKYLR